MADEGDRLRLFGFLAERFGIPMGLFDDHLLFVRKKNWWLLRDSPFLSTASRIKVSLVGLRAFSQVGDFVKPSTRLIQLFGHRATKARWDIGEAALPGLVAGDLFPADLPLENGYVIISLKGHVLGLGLLIDGFIRSQIPKKELRFLTT